MAALAAVIATLVWIGRAAAPVGGFAVPNPYQNEPTIGECVASLGPSADLPSSAAPGKQVSETPTFLNCRDRHIGEIIAVRRTAPTENAQSNEVCGGNPYKYMDVRGPWYPTRLPALKVVTAGRSGIGPSWIACVLLPSGGTPSTNYLGSVHLAFLTPSWPKPLLQCLDDKGTGSLADCGGAANKGVFGLAAQNGKETLTDLTNSCRQLIISQTGATNRVSSVSSLKDIRYNGRMMWACIDRAS